MRVFYLSLMKLKIFIIIRHCCRYTVKKVERFIELSTYTKLSGYLQHANGSGHLHEFERQFKQAFTMVVAIPAGCLVNLLKLICICR